MAVASRAVSMAAILISVPLTLSYLGAERYALWMTVSSAVALLAILDLGVGNGLVTLIAEADGRGDASAIRSHVSTGYVVVAFVMAASLALFFAVYPFVPWASLFNVSSEAAKAESGPTVAVLFAGLAIGLPLNLVHKIQAGLQEGVSSNTWTLAGSVLSLAGLLMAIHLQGSLPWLVLGMMLGPLVASSVNTILFFRRRHSSARPRARSVSRASVGRVLEFGFMFMVVQLATLVNLQAQNLILIHMLGPQSVAEYATTQRVFVLVPIIVGLLLGPLWPAYGEAISRGDRGWAGRAFRRSLLMSLSISVPINLVLALFGQGVMRVWLGGAIAPPEPILLAGFAAFGILNAISGSFAVFLNGVGAMRYQAAFGALMAFATVLLGIFLTHLIGVSGVIWGLVIATLVFSMLPSALFVRQFLRKRGEASSFQSGDASGGSVRGPESQRGAMERGASVGALGVGGDKPQELYPSGRR